MKITVQLLVQAPIAAVWRAYVSPADIVKWNAASPDWHTTRAEVDLRPGGAFSSRMEAKDGSFGFDFAGTYTAVDQHRRIAYDMGGRQAEVMFDDHGDPSGTKGTSVSVTFDGEPTHSEEQQRQGWQAILDNFKRHVEAGAA